MNGNKQIIIAICIVLIVLVIFLGYESNKEVEKIVQKQFNKQQLMLVKQAASGIEGFINEKVITIEILAKDESDKSLSNFTRSFETIYNKTSGIYVIEFINKNGVVVSGYPKIYTPIGYDLYSTNNSYVFEKVRETKKTYISDPIPLFEGGLGSFIWVPVYDNEEFKGVILAIIKIYTISEQFLAPIESGESGYAYMINNKGVSLYDGAHRRAVGKKYSKILNNTNPSWINILNKQKNGSEGTGYYFENNKKRIVAYSPITMRNQLWSVAISVPESEVSKLIHSVYLQQIFFIGAVITIILSGSLWIILMFSRWNKELEKEVEIKTMDLKKSKNELEIANKKLKELDKLKSEFVSIVSHELKTPLTAMKISAQVLESLPENDIKSRSRKELLKIIIRNIDRQTNLINDLLEISRIESGRMKLKMEKLSLPEIIKNSVDHIKPSASKKNISINIELPEKLPKIIGDRDKLIQVLVNLLNNAIKFTPKDGNITVKTSAKDKQVEVKVKDTGIGIAQQDLDKVFDKFYQVDSGLTRKVGGTGLGLAICKGIIESHGGSIMAESEFGKGSTFIFTVNRFE